MPATKISQFSPGEFCGIMADTFENKIKRKTFRGNIYLPSDQYKKKYTYQKPIEYTKEDIEKNVLKIKKEVSDLLFAEMEFFK